LALTVGLVLLGGSYMNHAVHRSAGPKVTVTGHLRGDPNVELRFGSEPEPARSRILRLRDSRELDRDWYEFPNTVRARKIGCYQVRFKSDHFDETLTLRIISIGANFARPISRFGAPNQRMLKA
jgi:hypothetical protein